MSVAGAAAASAAPGRPVSPHQKAAKASGVATEKAEESGFAQPQPFDGQDQQDGQDRGQRGLRKHASGGQRRYQGRSRVLEKGHQEECGREPDGTAQDSRKPGEVLARALG
jgi:hypothetical protein